MCKFLQIIIWTQIDHYLLQEYPKQLTFTNSQFFCPLLPGIACQKQHKFVLLSIFKNNAVYLFYSKLACYYLILHFRYATSTAHASLFRIKPEDVKISSFWRFFRWLKVLSFLFRCWWSHQMGRLTIINIWNSILIYRYFFFFISF